MSIVTTFRKYGMMLSTLYIRHCDKAQIVKIINTCDFKRINNVYPRAIRNIYFYVGALHSFSGGITSILRLGSILSEMGRKIFYIVEESMDIKIARRNAQFNLNGYKGCVISLNEYHDMQPSTDDVIIATSAFSVYKVIKMKGYKMYFVQDYEPYFSDEFELSLLARKTYDMGLHIISLGTWNRDIINGNIQSEAKIDCIDFPYEKKEYSVVERDYISYQYKRRLNIAVYLKETSKRLPVIIPEILKSVSCMFQKDGIELNFTFYGGIRTLSKSMGTNLGKIPKEQLMDLYSKSDFGMVASMTNISLVPYEMLATGLPLIEFEDGSFPHFFTKDCALLTSYSPEDLYNKIKMCLADPSIFLERNRNAQEELGKLSWEKSANQFNRILSEIEGTEINEKC